MSEGNQKVEKYMPKVAAAIDRHINHSKNQKAWADIYNRCYEAVSQAIEDYSILKEAVDNTAQVDGIRLAATDIKGIENDNKDQR
jgi:hypothetical protein